MGMKRETTNTVKSCGTRNFNKIKKEGSKLKKLSGRTYKEWLKSLVKAKGSDHSFERESLLPQTHVNVTGPQDSSDDETTNTNSSLSLSQPERSRTDFQLRRARHSGHAKRSYSPDLVAQTEKIDSSILESQENVDVSKLQEKFVHPSGEENKSTTTDFVEYWVPVRLSNIQTELYCGSLFSNSTILCSSYKFDPIKVLHEILISTKNCCDHPYLVDQSLHASLIQGTPQPEQLDAQIKMSSKLLLLHKALLEINKRGLRVLVLYQSKGGSGLITTGDILDDIIHETFGGDSFVRIEGYISRSKRQEVLDTFNQKEGGKFVCLMETRACVPSIKLKSIDTVIIFSSDWDPTNDLKALRKINLDSQFEQVKVFRLYSAYTLEEKVLILTKQGMTPDGNVRTIRRSTCHEFLTWGAFYLFEKLEELHSVATTDGNLFVEDVFHELSILLPNNDKSDVDAKTSSIMQVQQIGGVYPSDISLAGEVGYSLMHNYSAIEEVLTKEPPYIFWINILEGRTPSWKYFSYHSPRTRRSVQSLDGSSKKCRTEAGSSSSQTSGESPVQTTRRASHTGEAVRAPETSQVTHVEVLQSVCKALETELERLETQKTESSKQFHLQKQQARTACEREIAEIQKKYDSILQDADATFLGEKEVLETRYNKILVNKALAEALMQRDSKNASLTQVATKFSVEQAYRLISQVPGSRAEQGSSRSVASPADTRHVQAGGMRAPAPHFRHSPPRVVAKLSSERPAITFSPVSLVEKVTSPLPALNS